MTDPYKIQCRNCDETMSPVLSRQDGECVAWCQDCGAMCSFNIHDILGSDDFCFPKGNVLRPGEVFRQRPVNRLWP